LSTEKHIVIVNQFAGTSQSGWGERHFFLAKHWQKMGHKVTIISSANNHMFNNPLIFKGTYKHQIFEGVPFIWVNIPSYNPASIGRFGSMIIFTLRLLKIPRNILIRADVLVVSSMPIFPFLVLPLLRLKWSIKRVIFEIRDMWPMTPIYLMNYSKYHPFILFLSFLQKYALRVSDSIASLLPNNKEYLSKLAKKDLNWYYLPNGINDQVNSAQLIPELERLNLNGKFIICYAGTIGYANALDILIELIKTLSRNDNFHFLLVGDGYLKSKYQKDLGDCRNVTFISKIPKLSIPSLLSKVHVCFIAWHRSKLYDFGVSANKYFDYMLSGKPVLVYSSGFTDPIVMSGGGIVVKEEGVEALHQDLVRLKQMTHKERQIMGQKGREFVLKHHSYQKIAEKYVVLFH